MSNTANQHVVHDDPLMRPNEIAWSQGNSEKAQQLLGWQATKRMNDVINILCEVQRFEK